LPGGRDRNSGKFTLGVFFALRLGDSSESESFRDF